MAVAVCHRQPQGLLSTSLQVWLFCFRCGVGSSVYRTDGLYHVGCTGTYLVSGSIIAYYNTQLVGDVSLPHSMCLHSANDLFSVQITAIPTIVAASSFVGLGVISTDVYYDGDNGGEWYINTVSRSRPCARVFSSRERP